MTTTAQPRNAHGIAGWELQGTVFCTGAIVMLIEILGTRVIGPVFGVSVFVWAALLSVTLLALASGYYGGGVMVDRAPRASRLGWVLLFAGAALGVVPLVAPPVLGGASGLGPRSGPLLAALVLFAPALTALGMTSPIAVRLAMTDVAAAGQRAGKIYALSTAGSLLGTLITSFWLIPEYDSNHILLGAAGALILLGATILMRRGRAWAGAALVVPLFGGLARPPHLPANIRILATSHSLYGLVEVIEDTSRDVRYLRSDHSIIGAHWTRDGSAAFAFLHAMEILPFVRPAAKSALVIGLGTGAVPSSLTKNGMRVDVVEIDPAVAQFAEKYFWFKPSGTTYVEDARTFTRRTENEYDIIVHDTFTGGATPEHLLSSEVIHQIHRLLRPGGVLALNMVGFQHGPNAGATWAVARTLRAEFPTVRAFRDGPPERHSEDTTNIIFLASDDQVEPSIPADAHFNDAYCARILPELHNWEILQQVPPGDTISDAHNPLSRLQLPVAEKHYDAMLEMLPLEVWLH